jgi:hypothetical protein
MATQIAGYTPDEQEQIFMDVSRFLSSHSLISLV